MDVLLLFALLIFTVVVAGATVALAVMLYHRQTKSPKFRDPRAKSLARRISEAVIPFATPPQRFKCYSCGEIFEDSDRCTNCYSDLFGGA